SDPKKETVVTSAELSLYNRHPVLRHQSQTDHQFTTAKLYLLLRPNSNSSRPVRKLLHTRLIQKKELPGWNTFDLTDVVKHWLKQPSENYGLEILTEVTSSNQGIHFNARNIRRNTVAATDTTTEDLLPFLKVFTAQRHILGRAKRAPERYDCRVGDNEKRCCRYPLWVSFSDIGYDEWVLSPEGYQAYYCDGACPDRYKPANNFAGIKSILHMINPRSVPGPCCTASKTDSLDLLLLDDVGNLVVKEYAGMVVQDCKCS
ncbi:bone morphogenetic protein 4-like, partial [Liolophura sinensis]|uniref:bone morphogenetic protein 4-like n=1 Tax=Liolophura sinensis TaxID=3198878 RepID=UPI00315826C3